MPTHLGHQATSKVALGDKYEFMNAWMDALYPFLGYNHRVARHDPFQFYAHFSDKSGGVDPELGAAFMLHLVTDNASSADPVLRALIDALGPTILKQNDPGAFSRAYIILGLSLFT